MSHKCFTSSCKVCTHEMPTDITPGWASHKRDKHPTNICEEDPNSNQKSLPGVTWLSDLLKVINVKRQTGYTNDDPFDVPKSYAHVPHQFLAPDGFPKPEFWLHHGCRSAIPPKAGSKYGKGRVVERALDRYREEGVEGLPEPFQRPEKTYSKPRPRHAKQAEELNAARAEDQSPDQQIENTFSRACDQLNDPVLPFENYERTMDIILHLYTIIDHGKGQFVDRKSKKLIFTYAFEDLETMKPEEREEHQQDVSTILMSTKLFRRLPTPKKSPQPVPREFRPRATKVNKKLLPTPKKSPQPVPREFRPRATKVNKKLHECADSAAHDQQFDYDLIDGASTLPLSINGALSYMPSSPLTSLPPSDSEPFEPLEKTPHYQEPYQQPPSSPLTSLPPSDAEDIPIIPPLLSRKRNTISKTASLIPAASKKRKRADLTHVEPLIPPNKRKANVTTNGALINGKMYCFGQTVGYTRDILISPYMPINGSSKPLYRKFLDRLPDFGDRTGSRFKSFCNEGFRGARQQLNDLKAPSMASTSKLQPSGPLDFAANFAFTFANFYNKPHTDNDKGKVYCLWYPIDIKTGKIVTGTEGFVLEGGWFIFPEFRVAINFGNKSAVQIAWNGKSTFHHTIPSKEKVELKDGVKVHYTRLGCSSQITYKMAVAAGKIGTDCQFNYTSNCERNVRDADDILALEDRHWKN
ncbi:uncharacterized protein MELLADRAFT_94700 [Melampsora larici-populina 98AG31]|uniref:Tet-like 2OG-Fe(II) oxygenase domain-containing protein n=1 Tax=Melampsora larici-populina (strain 98AG31 / pathotype 3-4-7) TaxID=747676 RepID=F4S7M8_MELLP|nr:uncharacterized protein MELLADRAFT_94700 [Melampsora larici-populina 98AG31]EGF99349.1 hypothetical protein MELLADRAFT_94700 [Melampsora larici-populina 98AG31]